ncbi:hypothetical protein [Chondromyces apiculatus]|uniref:Trypsin-like peptidase domain-containing protein n=1 Tax=Chondromyces apiculatus DSM 436 TaxID=1192034 RepID=A0A017TCX6_9BACT|nr:hypothetical protein [Chondromyces apiculatus]EYF06782.1 Hypothetical protein CAP_1479 [Chondromyces apiculatus DSM 436]
MDLDDKIAFVQSTMNPMAWHTYPHIVSVLGVESNASGQHVGSALRFRMHGRRGIVTAAHVIREAQERYGRVAVTAIRGDVPYEFRGKPDLFDATADLAIYFLADDYPTEGVSFWPQERMDPDDAPRAVDYLFIHGFPAVRSRFSALASGVMSRSLPYGVMQRDDDLPSDLQSFQFAMDFDPENLRGPDGQPTDWLDPHGLSGSPVWRIGAGGRRVDTWSPERSLLVGIVTQWRPTERILVATKCRNLVEMLGSA